MGIEECTKDGEGPRKQMFAHLRQQEKEEVLDKIIEECNKDGEGPRKQMFAHLRQQEKEEVHDKIIEECTKDLAGPRTNMFSHLQEQEKTEANNTAADAKTDSNGNGTKTPGADTPAVISRPAEKTPDNTQPQSKSSCCIVS